MNKEDANQIACFELRQDEDTGRLYWWGSEDAWKDATEIGVDGVLILDARHFAAGTILTLTEPMEVRTTCQVCGGAGVLTERDGGETFEIECPECGPDIQAASERINKRFYEKLAERYPNHPWLKTERAEKALNQG